VASDLGRYPPLVRSLGVTFALVGVARLWVELAAGVPWWRAASEGPGGVAVGAVLFWLARPPREGKYARPGGARWRAAGGGHRRGKSAGALTGRPGRRDNRATCFAPVAGRVPS